MSFVILLVSFSSFVVSAESQVARRDSFDVSEFEYDEDIAEDVEYEFKEGDKFVLVTFDLEQWYSDTPKLQEVDFDVRITETNLKHGTIDGNLGYSHDFKHRAVPALSTWKIKTTKKGKRLLEVKVKKWKERVDWDDPFKDGVADSTKNTAKANSKAARSLPKAAPSEAAQAPSDDTTQDHSSILSSWIVRMSLGTMSGIFFLWMTMPTKPKSSATCKASKNRKSK